MPTRAERRGGFGRESNEGVVTMLSRPGMALISGLLCVAAVANGCGGGSDGSPGGEDRSTFCPDDEVHVSYAGPLSGSSADFGEQQVRGIELAIDKVNEDGGIADGPLRGCRIALDGPFDDESSTTTGVQIATNLTRDDQLLAYLGNVNSPVVLAVEPVLARADMPMLVSYASAPEITSQGFENVARTILNGNQYGAAIAEILVKEFKRTRIAAAWVNDAYGQPQIDAFRESVPQLGGELVVDYSYETGQTDFSAFVSEARAANADAVALLGNYGEGALITEQLDAAGMNAGPSLSIVGAAGNNSPEFVKIAGDNAEDVYFASNWNPGAKNAENEDFIRKYEQAYGESPAEPAATGYDSLMLFASAVASGGTNRAALIDALHSVRLDGVTGKLRLDSNGQAVGLDLALLQVRDGRIVPASDSASR